MEEIFEIRDGCKTSLELLNSKAFSQYLEIYKTQFIRELKLRENTDQKEEVIHKIEFIKSIQPKIFVDIIKNETPFSGDALMKHRQNIRFIDGCFHHYRKKSYTRLIKLHDEILNSD